MESEILLGPSIFHMISSSARRGGILLHHRLSCAMRICSRSIIEGRATTEDTKKFVLDNFNKHKIQLYHQLNKSKLYLNPVIHGPPLKFQLTGKNNSHFDQLLLRAVTENRCNAVCIYDYHSNWHCSNLAEVVSKVPRESLILFANIGPPAIEDEIQYRLANVRKVCKVSDIDFAVVTVID